MDPRRCSRSCIALEDAAGCPRARTALCSGRLLSGGGLRWASAPPPSGPGLWPRCSTRHPPRRSCSNPAATPARRVALQPRSLGHLLRPAVVSSPSACRAPHWPQRCATRRSLPPLQAGQRGLQVRGQLGARRRAHARGGRHRLLVPSVPALRRALRHGQGRCTNEEARGRSAGGPSRHPAMFDMRPAPLRRCRRPTCSSSAATWR